MKTIKLFLVLFLATPLFCGCENNNNGNEGGTPPTIYALDMDIRDANNNGVVEGVRYASKDASGICDVDYLDYNLVAKMMIDSKRTPNVITMKHLKFPEKDGSTDAVFTTSIVSYHIFNDTKKHDVITTWRDVECIRVVCDGKEYIPYFDKEKYLNSVVLTLDYFQ